MAIAPALIIPATANFIREFAGSVKPHASKVADTKMFKTSSPRLKVSFNIVSVVYLT